MPTRLLFKVFTQNPYSSFIAYQYAKLHSLDDWLLMLSRHTHTHITRVTRVTWETGADAQQN